MILKKLLAVTCRYYGLGDIKEFAGFAWTDIAE